VSARGWHRVLRVARTIADLQGREALDDPDVAEAFQYRQNGLELAAEAQQAR
jgi:magnesium chelatase family protein